QLQPSGTVCIQEAVRVQPSHNTKLINNNTDHTETGDDQKGSSRNGEDFLAAFRGRAPIEDPELTGT
ncbi:hypothetical protein KUCAC02_032009, partial [Chaenocephalus aceratus]